MTPKQLIEYYGGSNLAVAHAIGYTEPAIRHWINKKKIPYKAQRLIESVTNGKLVARKAKPRLFDDAKPAVQVQGDML